MEFVYSKIFTGNYFLNLLIDKQCEGVKILRTKNTESDASYSLVHHFFVYLVF
jgi:hypothetical protein